MKSEEARIAEAVSSLTGQLEAWGADEAPSKADLIIKELLRAGWRPRAREVWTPPGVNGGQTASAETAAQAAASARAAMRAAKTDTDTKRQATTGSLREREEAS